MFQSIQLLLCDWLLTTRTDLWEMTQPGDKGDKPASQVELIAFQQDLGSLRKLSQVNKAALPKVTTVYSALNIYMYARVAAMIIVVTELKVVCQGTVYF